jgi:hypothetical protein
MNLFELPCDERDRLSKSINTTKKTIETLQINLKNCESNFSSDSTAKSQRDPKDFCSALREAIKNQEYLMGLQTTNYLRATKQCKMFERY